MIEWNEENYTKLHKDWFDKLNFTLIKYNIHDRIRKNWAQDNGFGSWEKFIEFYGHSTDTIKPHPESFIYFVKDWLYKQKVDILLK